MGIADGARLIFEIRGDTSQLGSDFAKGSAIIKGESAKILSEFQKANAYKADFKSSTDVLIAESQKAIANAENVALGAAHAIQTTTTSLTAAQSAASSLSGTFANMLGPVSAVAGGVGTLAFGLLQVQHSIFGLVKDFSDLGSQIHDVAQATGLSATTISSLKFAADQSNSSIEQWNAGLKRFTITIGDAARGSDSAKEKLVRLGIDPTKAINDLDGALSKALKTINDAAPGVERVGRAADAFGKRTGSDLIPTVEHFHGNLQDLIKDATELGVVIDDNAARVAREFKDQMKTIDAQLVGVKNRMANEFAPSMTQGLRDFSQELKENKTWLQFWANTFTEIIPIIGGFASVVSRGLLPTLEAVKRQMISTVTGVADDVVVRSASRDTSDVDTKGDSKAEKARREAERKLEQDLKSIEDTYKEHTETLAREYKLQETNLAAFTQKSIEQEDERYDKTKTILEKQRDLAKPGSAEREKYEREIEKLTQDSAARIEKIQDEASEKQITSLRANQDAQIALIEDYSRRAEAAYQALAESRGITFEKAEYEIKELQAKAFDSQLEALYAEQRRIYQAVGVIYNDAGIAVGGFENVVKANVEALADVERKIAAIVSKAAAAAEESERRIDEAKQKDIDSLLKINDALYNTELQYEQQSRESHKRQLDDYAKWALRHVLLTKTHNALIIYERASLDQQEESARHAREMAQLTADEAALKRTAFTEAEKLNIEKTYNGFREQENQRHIAAQNDINKRADEATKSASGDSEGGLLGGIKEDLNKIPDLSPVAFAADAVTIAYKNMKQAVLDSVDAFIFSGESIGKVMRSAVAETLAEIGKEAAIQGIKQTALSLGSLAVGDFRGFALHGLAAAAWFSITAGSMLVGRGVMGPQASAGAALNQSTQPASRSTTTTTTTQPKTIEVSRPTTAHQSRVESLLVQVVNKLDSDKVMTHEIKPPDGWVVTEIVQNFRRNGKVRDLITDPYNAH